MKGRWVIWSNEHQAWWGPGRWGYTRHFVEAGRYSREEAAAIVAQAEIVPHDPPNEVMLLEPEEP